MHHKFFIGHRRPDFPLWEGFQFYDIPAELQQMVGSGFDQNFTDHRIFNEYSFLFLLRRQLERTAAANDLVTICQYRRFVLNRRVGQQSTTTPWSLTITPQEARHLRIVDEVLPAPGQSYLIGPGVLLEVGLLGQYSRVHFARDILRFTSAIVDAGLLADHQAFEFLSGNVLIPSPSCGTFRVDSFLQIFRLLEFAASSFWNNGFRPYQHQYQGRVCSFLLERLNSYLLLKYLADHGTNPRDVTGSTTMVSDTAAVKVGNMVPA